MKLKLIGKRGKIYKQLLKEGKTEAYAKRISKGLSEGKTLSQARGHKEERLKHAVRKGTAYQPAEKGRLEKKKEEWLAYAYVDPVQSQSYHNTYLSLSSRDITKTSVQNYGISGSQEALYRVHQFLEDELNAYLIHERLDVISSNFNELHIDTYHETLLKRRFEFEVVDLVTLDVRFYLIFEKGKLQKIDVWEQFPITEFIVLIGGEGIWN